MHACMHACNSESDLEATMKERRWFRWSLFSKFSQTGMNFIFIIIPSALYIVWTDGVSRLSRLGDFIGLTPPSAGIKSGVRVTAPQNSTHWSQKKSSASAFPLLEKWSVGMISQKSSSKSHYDVRIVNPGPGKDIFVLNYRLVGFPILQMRVQGGSGDSRPFLGIVFPIS